MGAHVKGQLLLPPYVSAATATLMSQLLLPPYESAATATLMSQLLLPPYVCVSLSGVSLLITHKKI